LLADIEQEWRGGLLELVHKGLGSDLRMKH
jgi:hypothetical protein